MMLGHIGIGLMGKLLVLRLLGVFGLQIQFRPVRWMFRRMMILFTLGMIWPVPFALCAPRE